VEVDSVGALAQEAILEAETLQSRILVADDQQDVLEALRLLLKGQGYAIEMAASPAALLEAVELQQYDLILMDLNYARDTTSGREGIDLLASLKKVENLPPVVVMTGWATVGLAVEAMQQGVGDFIEKPWLNSRLLEVVRAQIEMGRSRAEARRRAQQEAQARSNIDLQLHHQKHDLEEAWAIQQGFLPKEIPQIAGIEISAAWQPAQIVGGDYFDVLPFGERNLGFCIADVAGKGLPAALLMSNLQAGVRGMAASLVSPQDLCARLNSLLCRNIAADRFITFFYGHFEGRNRQLQYANAGHNAPIVVRRNGSHQRLTHGGGILGVFPGQAFECGAAELEPGDRVILFTDGVTEAQSSKDEEFGEARLISLLEENRALTAEELQKKILSAVADFNSGNWHDDATLLILAVE
jgi:phosphoserine phosphatase RsbU/P